MRSRLSPLLALKKKIFVFPEKPILEIRDDFILSIAYNLNIKSVLAAEGKLNRICR